MNDENTPHYERGPSGAKTWRTCKGCVAKIEHEQEKGNLPEKAEDTAYSQAGTLAHSYADKLMRGEITPEDQEGRMRKRAIPDEFWFFLRDYHKLGQTISNEVGGGDCEVFCEQQVPLFYKPDAVGTLDWGCVAEDGSEIVILDLKWGEGVWVDAFENDQQIIYAISLIRKLEAEGYKFNADTKVSCIIYQPRHRQFDGPNLWETTYDELQDYAVDIENDHAESVAATHEDLTPTDAACQFCDAKKACVARTLEAFEEVPDAQITEFNHRSDKVQLPSIAELSPHQRVSILKFGKTLQKWIDEANKDSLERIEQGESIPGLKSVDGKLGHRKWSDETEVATNLLRGIKVVDKFTMKLKSPAQVEQMFKAMGDPISGKSTRWKNKFNKLTVQNQGKAQLALAEDPRPSRDVLVFDGIDKSDGVNENVAAIKESDCF